MPVKVKTGDGKKEILTTKWATVEDVKREVERQLHVRRDLQQLFFSGKQLEDGYHLYNYNITYNDTILLTIKTEINNTKNKITSGNEEEIMSEEEEEGEELEKAESLYYKIGDAVDCIAQWTGAWHEAIIQNIYIKREELFYKISWEFSYVTSPNIITKTHIRPRARRSISFDELSVGQKVMINYDIDEPKKIGLWYDFTISQIEKKKRLRELVGQLYISSDNELSIRKKVTEEIYAIEAPKLLTERTEEDERFMTSDGKGRPVALDCEDCWDNPDMKCQSCGCKVCAGKEEENTLLICDECEYMFHMKCLNPPLLELPQEPHWYCPECKNDENEVVKAGDKLKETKKKPLHDSKKRNWGGGMICARRPKICTMVPKNHCGPIPGVDVGTTWKYRIQVSEAGVHRLLVGGIHGRIKDCAYSIVLTGGYKGDYDNGDEFLYSGSGGRDLSGNRRTNVQSKDQELTKMNLALANNCNAPVNVKDGAAATDSNWKEGKPVRVIRNYKLKSEYAPEQGNRYDGIYKVIKYYPDTSTCGYRMWKYVLRRDDPTPAPWTEGGKAIIAFPGLKMLYPDGHLDTMKKLNKTGAEKRSAIDDEEDNVALKKSKKLKRVFDLEDETEINNTKNKITSGNEESIKEEEMSEEEEEGEELEKAESLYYKIGDAVDCIAQRTGAWHEAIIQNIYKKRDELFYKISWEFSYVTSPNIISKTDIRPRARRSIPFDELSVGQKVMINYDIDEPKEFGLWYDFTISQIGEKKILRELVGQLHISSDNELSIRKKVTEEIYAIEAPKLLTERTEEDERFMTSDGKGRPVALDCEDCGDNPDMKCQSCSCKVCAGKEEENTLLICDECQDMFHMKCLNPPLLELPQEPHWYCPECKNDENEVVKAGDKLKETKKKPLHDSKKRNWGTGMACARRQKICTMVPKNHCGPIPGVDVGTTWKYRIQVSEAGVHRPLVHGIHGRIKDCAYSIVLAGGYKGDYDNGDEFLYSGSGGRDLSGNRRTNVQSKDQELTKMNLALANNCNAPVNVKDGAAGTDSNWKEGKPVRVIRNYKLKSEYAPEQGNRYDGIYKVIKYYPDTSTCGYRMWKYVLKRDDPTPAPWTEEGKAIIAFLGLNDGHFDTMKKLNKTGAEKRSAIDDEEDNVAIKKAKKLKRVSDLVD